MTRQHLGHPFGEVFHFERLLQEPAHSAAQDLLGLRLQAVARGDEGDHVAFFFCPTCGATVYWEIPDLPGFVVVAVGAFADPAFKAPTFSVYEDRKHAWVVVPDTVTERWG